jgi:hypothetical protein
MLSVLIESIDRIYKNKAIIKVLYNNLSKNWVNNTEKKIDMVEFIFSETNNDLQNFSRTKLPSMKIELWYKALKTCEGNERIVLLDSDMVVLKNMDKYFRENFDIGYTFKTSEDENLNWILNTGIILVNNLEKSLSFFELWKERVNYILSNQDLDNIAGRDWGAADQAALGEYLNIKGYRDCFQDIIKENCCFRGFKCCELNETRCVPISESLHIIHFKGLWHKVLSEKKFNEWRTKEKCLQMYNVWNDLYKSFINKTFC